VRRPASFGARRFRGVPRERGVVLFVALIVLVVMALAGLAMIRQSGTGLSIAGNIGMRQNALSGADLGTEAALAWWQPLLGTPGALDSDIVAQGYFSDWGTTDPTRITGDPTQYNWGNSVLVTADDGTGNEVRYIIERLCMVANQPSSVAGQQCVETALSNGNDMSGTCDNYPQSCPPPATTVNYRVSSRVKGLRNTVSYIQVMLVSTS
jgi:type IV pilus assembly protein PilX